ncbi:unnamed protein product [Phytophthora fragariaefolia]|uniref:Unnamed protein product n=1 Tax=Phytophthora fragariaefolia TaxID=1490495 RepID=A0A9W6TXA1_9STRA|nr:unnamed protein product [Phytophthora fragariaefolia]
MLLLPRSMRQQQLVRQPNRFAIKCVVPIQPAAIVRHFYSQYPAPADLSTHDFDAAFRLRRDAVGSSITTLENFSFPSSATTLNFSNNPITLIKGVIFPDSLTELILLSTATTAATATTASTDSVVTPEEARALQTTATDPTTQEVTVLEEFEVRQSDADRFEKLTLWDVSTTSTLSCSDSKANPRYVQDTMLCVLSDSDFAAKYESVVIAASSESRSGSMWGTDASSTQAVKRIVLKETLHQRRSWFLIGAAAMLSAFTILMLVNTFCMCLRRNVRNPKTKGGQLAMAKTASGRSNNFWHESASMEPDDEVRQLLRSDPPSTDENSSQPEPEFLLKSEVSPAKEFKPSNPLLRLLQELPRDEIDGSLIKRREVLPTTSLEIADNGYESSSPFIYFKAVYRGKKVVLKTLGLTDGADCKNDERDNGISAELWGFVEEIRLSSTLSHPQLVAFCGFVKTIRLAEHSAGDGVALVMEYMGNGDLNTFIQAHKRTLQLKKVEHSSMSGQKNSLDQPMGHEESGNGGENDYEEDLLQAKEADIITVGSRRWNWRSSSTYKSKLAIAIEVAQAVQYLHSFSQPLFHGNLSSRKVFLDSEWNVKLGDFTCCSALRRWSSSHTRNAIGSLPSTMASARCSGRSNTSSQATGEEIHMDMTVWTAPEVLDGRQYTPKADIYSFGVLLSQLATYECTSAEHSVMDDMEVPMLNNTHTTHSSGDGEAPTPVRLLMFRCQAFQPEVRPTAEELLQELHQIEHDLVEKS